MDWPEVAAEIAREIAPKIDERVINGAVVIIIVTAAGTILAKLRQKLSLSGGSADIQRQLDALAKSDDEFRRRLERIEGDTAQTNIRVAEIHGALLAGVRITSKP